LEYEDLVRDKENSIKGILDFIGCAEETACYNPHLNNRAVKTASLSQVRKPINGEANQAWKSYRKHIEPHIDLFTR
jgi:hypothetical protein